MFFQSENFTFSSILESSLLLIRQELERLQEDHFVAWPEKFLYGKGWEVFGLYAYGNKLKDNCRLCPKTTRLVEMIPGMITAGFSSLQSGTHIVPHVGYSNSVLTFHLGLIVPDGCILRVGTQTRNWQEGKCLIFDDTVEHEVWNYSDTNRIVLLVNFKKKYLTENKESQGTCSPEVEQLIGKLKSSNS